MSIEAMKQALKALEEATTFTGAWPAGQKAITTLRTAIEQAEKQEPPYRAVKTVHEGKPVYVSEPAAPVQEPVAWRWKREGGEWQLVHQQPRSPTAQPLYTTPPAQEFVCSTGLCHYKATSEKRECMNCAAFGECNPNNDAGRCGYEPPAAQRQWVGLTDEQLQEIEAATWGAAFLRPQSARDYYRAIEAKLREKNGGAA